jgi:hypothetical protein
MSLFQVYNAEDVAVVASDDRACLETHDGWKPVEGRYPKFVVADSHIIGAVGRNDLSAKFMNGMANMIRGEKLSLDTTAGVTPYMLSRMWEKRATGLSPAADKLHAAVVGYDHAKGRIRSRVFLSDNGFREIDVTANPHNKFFSLGAFQGCDEVAQQRLTEKLAALGSKNGPAWIASELQQSIEQLASRYSAIGKPAYFAAVDKNGLVGLPSKYALPPSQFIGPKDARAIATAGRFFVGSITTPSAGGVNTVGNGDGGSGSVSSGSTNSSIMSEANVESVGTGVVTNPNNAVDGDMTTYATLTVTGNGANGNTAGLEMSNAAGLVQKSGTMTLQILAAIQSNSLNGNVGNACFYMDYSTKAAYGGDTPVAGTPCFPLNVSGAQHTFPLQTFTVTLPVPVNPGAVTLGIYANANADSTSGSLVARIYDVRVVSLQ